MGNGSGATEVPTWPPPPSPAPRMASFFFAGAAAVAGFLGYCTIAGVLALLSLIFNLWDYFQRRGPRGTPPGTGGGANTSGLRMPGGGGKPPSP